MAKLNIYWQQTKELPPIYKLIQETGPDHSKTFVMECEFMGHRQHGSAFNKKDAKENAAREILKHLKPLEPPQTQYKIVEVIGDPEKLFHRQLNKITINIRRRDGDEEEFNTFDFERIANEDNSTKKCCAGRQHN